MTGRQESINKAEDRMEKMIADKSADVKGFYYSMLQSGKTASYMTRRNYVYAVLKFKEKVNKHYSEIEYDDIVWYLNDLGKKKDGTQKTGSYMDAVHAALKRYFMYLTRSGKIQKNPMEYVDRPAPTPSDQIVRISLTKQEFQKCITNTRKSQSKFSKRDELAMAIMITTGVRISALININLEDISEDGVLKIIDKRNHYREFQLSRETMKLCAEWEAERRVIADNTSALFVSSEGTRITQNGFRKAIAKRCELTGKHITPHKFRRSCATWLHSEGGSLYDVQQYLGHSSPKTTEIYLQDKAEATVRANGIANNFYR